MATMSFKVNMSTIKGLKKFLRQIMFDPIRHFKMDPQKTN